MNVNISTSIHGLLSRRINKKDVEQIVSSCKTGLDNLEMLYKLSESSDNRISMNALWCMTHLPKTSKSWLQSKQSMLIDRLLIEEHLSKKRLLLQLLRNQTYANDSIRTDFLDFCFSRINSESEPCAIRAFCIYCAFKMCRFYLELVKELEEHLDMLNNQTISPGLSSALHQTKKDIRMIRENYDTTSDYLLL